jgi:hypothetical protein
MPYYVPVDKGPDVAPLEAFPPTFGESLRSSVRSTFNENPATLLWDYGKLRSANSGPKLGRDQAQEQIKGAGVNLTVPDDGYTQEALDILIGRKQEAAARQSMDERTPWGWGSLVRGSAQLLTGIADPLNVASAFVPVVREVRAASWMARAGEGLAARAGVRAGIGAIEGAAGAAMLEPLVYGLHSAMSDDYTMVDSLVNLAFGTALGGVLHSGGGLVSDVAQRSTARLAQAELDNVRTAVERVAAAGPAAHEAGFRAAVADAVQGRAPDVDAAVKAATEPGVTFTTAKGSVYVLDERGMTTRDKAARNDVGHEGDSGPQPTSEATYFLTREQADALGEIQAKGGDVKRVIAELPDGRIGVKYTSGKFEARTVVSPERQPEVGMIPLELWEGGKVQHFGNEIASVSRRGPGPIDAVRASASKQADPDSLAIGSPDASRAADQRLTEAPKDEAVESAQAEMTAANEQYQAIRKNLELGGLPSSRLEAVDTALKSYDDGITDAKNVGEALMQYALCGLRQ